MPEQITPTLRHSVHNHLIDLLPEEQKMAVVNELDPIYDSLSQPWCKTVVFNLWDASHAWDM